jgi:hypothetical protein
MSELDGLQHCYPPSFISNGNDISVRLQVLSNNTLLESVRRFCASIPSGQRTKAGFTKLIVDDFQQGTGELMRSSVEDLLKLVSPPQFPEVQLALVCQFVHKWYGSTVASHLLCHPTR